MNCSRCQERVFLHAHGQLSSMERLLVEQHLESCSSCRSRWARWVAERDALRRAFAPVTELDGSTATRMMEAVGARIRSEPQLPIEPLVPALGARRAGRDSGRGPATAPPGRDPGGLPWLVIPVGEAAVPLPSRGMGAGRIQKRWLLFALAALLAIGVSAMAAYWGPPAGGPVDFSGASAPLEGGCGGNVPGEIAPGAAQPSVAGCSTPPCDTATSAPATAAKPKPEK